MKYVVFLRGINVGGRAMVKMDQLKKVFEEIGFTNVKTLLNSGNVTFETVEKNDAAYKKITEKLKYVFGWEIGVIIRSQKELETLVEENMFKNIKVTSETRLYVTFLSEKPKTNLKIPYESKDKDFKILKVTEKEIFSVLTLTPKMNTTEAMAIIEKEFGKKVTTRNWNTLLKVVNL